MATFPETGNAPIRILFWSRVLPPMLWRNPRPNFVRPQGFIELCHPTNGHTVPSGPERVHEIKHDGFRFICRLERGRVRAFSRHGTE